MSAYGETYLYGAMKNLGEAFDYAINTCGIDSEKFVQLFVSSTISEGFGKGTPKLIAGLSGTELVIEILGKSGINTNYPEPQIEYECSEEYWCGWALAYFQWKTGITFREIFKKISFSEILRLYPTMHEASEDKLVDTLSKIIERNSSISNLQQQRKQCGYSQRELSEKSGVNLRTLQQYELKAKNIRKASVETAMSLANALSCRVTDIL